ncbi:hypothetical protein [Atlantibacter subterraneus]|uniref:hypothetical protein n=1 Tax=Atlantibacter subterraneus TaxID=255519 RepID=UPI000F68169B|nr:hypothetical protein [Atlantibacter subterranea]
MENLTIADVVGYHGRSDSPPLAPRYRCFLRQLSSLVDARTPIESVDIDAAYAGDVSHATVLSYRSIWRRCARQAFPGSKVMRYPYKSAKTHSQKKGKAALRPSSWEGKRMTIPIPFPDRDITVYVDSPIDISDSEAERVRKILLAYAI